MRFAYADPPYPGQSRRVYGSHPDYAGEVDHAALIARLVADYPDGWALSTSSPALGEILRICDGAGAKVRVCSWVHRVVPRKPTRLMWSWEPLILSTPHWRLRHDADYISDSLWANQPIMPGITGQKPVAFCHWVFGLLAAGPDDDLDDLFPGSGAVGHAWDTWHSQLTLLGHEAQQEQPVGLPEYEGHAA